VIPQLGYYRNAYRLHEEGRENKGMPWERGAAPTRTWEGRLFHKLFVIEIGRLDRLPRSMYVDGSPTSSDERTKAKPPQALYLPWSVEEEQNLAQIITQKQHKSSVDSVLSAMMDVGVDPKRSDEAMNLLCTRSPADVAKNWSRMLLRVSRALSKKALTVEKLQADIGEKKLDTVQRYVYGKDTSWMLKKNALVREKLEAALGKPLLGPGTEDDVWVPWSQQFLEAARAVAEAESSKGKRAYDRADADIATLIVSASRLRAAVFGDSKFARSCDSTWVVRPQLEQNRGSQGPNYFSATQLFVI
jgi:hypothetical protein